MTRYRILEASLLASIVLFVGLAVSRCAKEQAGTFNEPALAQCKGVEWTGIASGDIQKTGATELPRLTKGHCTRILFSGPSTATLELITTPDEETWSKVFQITNPKDAEGWGGIAENERMRIETTSYASGPVHYAVFQAKPKQK